MCVTEDCSSKVNVSSFNWVIHVAKEHIFCCGIHESRKKFFFDIYATNCPMQIYINNVKRGNSSLKFINMCSFSILFLFFFFFLLFHNVSNVYFYMYSIYIYIYIYAWSSSLSSLSVLAIFEDLSLSSSSIFLFAKPTSFPDLSLYVLSLNVPSNLAITSDFVFAYSIFYVSFDVVSGFLNV